MTSYAFQRNWIKAESVDGQVEPGHLLLSPCRYLCTSVYGHDIVHIYAACLATADTVRNGLNADDGEEEEPVMFCVSVCSESPETRFPKDSGCKTQLDDHDSYQLPALSSAAVPCASVWTDDVALLDHTLPFRSVSSIRVQEPARASRGHRSDGIRDTRRSGGLVAFLRCVHSQRMQQVSAALGLEAAMLHPATCVSISGVLEDKFVGLRRVAATMVSSFPLLRRATDDRCIAEAHSNGLSSEWPSMIAELVASMDVDDDACETEVLLHDEHYPIADSAVETHAFLETEYRSMMKSIVGTVAELLPHH